MLILMKPEASEKEVSDVLAELAKAGFREAHSPTNTVMRIVVHDRGVETKPDYRHFQSMPGVMQVLTCIAEIPLNN